MKKYPLFKAGIMFLPAVLMMHMTSCESLDGIKDRLNQLETSVQSLQSTMKALQDAYNQGKVIKSVTPLNDAEAGGWLFTFSDNSEIRIENGINGIDGIDGADGFTPYLKIDQNGNWTVSYDNGETFYAVLDEDGEMVNAVAKDGIDGKDGADGYSVRIDTNRYGYYVIQTYKTSDPSVIIKEEVTPYTSKSTNVISSITENSTTHEITVTFADGHTYTFNQQALYPSQIALTSSSQVILTKGSQATIELQVTPIVAVFSNDGTDCKIELDKIGTRASYVNAPANYKLLGVSHVYDSNKGVMVPGRYYAIIKDNGVSSSYDEIVSLVLTAKDLKGNQVQVSSSIFEVKCGK